MERSGRRATAPGQRARFRRGSWQLFPSSDAKRHRIERTAEAVPLLALVLAIGRLDQEHAALYFQIIWSVLREPMRLKLEASAMEGQTQGKATFPPFAEKLIQRGKVEDKRETLLRLVARAGIALTEDERARMEGCADPALLDRWVDNMLGAKTATDVFS
jgi:hypothetical protein